eukprot:3828935-Prorocentrum_lima.AAC.1
MTSSLVGSEMCIRDRQRSCLCLWSFRKRSKGALHKDSSIQQQDCTPAVSYTHLTLPTICSV